MLTARLLTVSHSTQGVCPTPLPLDADPPGDRPLLDTDPLDACWEATPLPVNRMTHRCKNITLSQTSFVGGNDLENQDEK